MVGRSEKVESRLGSGFKDVFCMIGTGLKHVGCRLGEGWELIRRGFWIILRADGRKQGKGCINLIPKRILY